MICQLPGRLYGGYFFMGKDTMIPKRVFYMWLGSAKPIDVNLCFLSWQNCLKEYELIEINENKSKYFDFMQECKRNSFFDFVYRNKMWAYVADYVRCFVLEKFGGIWLDTDVSLYKNFDEFLGYGLFLGRSMESYQHIETALIGAKAHHPVIAEMLQFYQKEIWRSSFYTGPRIATYVLQKYGFSAKEDGGIITNGDIAVYPPKYFYPFNCDDAFEPSCITDKTVAIHWWKSSWSRPEIINWLKRDRLKGEKKSAGKFIASEVKFYLFGFLPFISYYPSQNLIKVFSLSLAKIKKYRTKTKAMLFNFIPLCKWRG